MSLEFEAVSFKIFHETVHALVYLYFQAIKFPCSKNDCKKNKLNETERQSVTH